jgi:hypothetical protein
MALASRKGIRLLVDRQPARVLECLRFNTLFCLAGLKLLKGRDAKDYYCVTRKKSVSHGANRANGGKE